VYWEGKNSGNKEVSSGIYFLLMRVDGRVVYGPMKIGYIRK